MTTDNASSAPLGRNEPCPCGSGKKVKRCCGKDTAPKLGTPARWNAGADGVAAAEASGAASPFPGFDPSQMDPAWLGQFQQALQRLPKGQLQRIQSLMQRAMAGKDVSRDAAELERMMPPEILALARSNPMAGALASAGGASTSEADAMSVEDARRLVEEAAQKGEISSAQAQELLANAPTSESEAKSGKFSKLWKSLTGKS